MASKVLLVTAPDDVYLEGLRILVVGLDIDQTKVISDVLNQIEFQDEIIIYIWKDSDDIKWLADKKLKSKFIVFNTDMMNQSLVGFLAASNKSYYFGNLKELSILNSKAIYSVEDCKNLFSEMIGQYEVR